MVRRARSSRGAFRAAPAALGDRAEALGDRAEVRRVAFRAVCLRAGVACLRAAVARRVNRAGRLPGRLVAADFRAGFAFLTPRRALNLAI